MKPEIREQVAQTIHTAREAWHASRRRICGSEHDEQGRTLDQAIADATLAEVQAYRWGRAAEFEAAVDELLSAQFHETVADATGNGDAVAGAFEEARAALVKLWLEG